MYTAWLSNNDIYPNAKCFYDNSTDAKELQLISPTLELEANSAGSFTFTLPPDHLYSGQFNPFSTIVIVVRDGIVLWEGRVIDEQCDFWNQKAYTCEGCFAYFNDSLQPYHQYSSAEWATPRDLLSKILEVHNTFFRNRNELYKTFELGVCLVNMPEGQSPGENEVFQTNYENSMDILSQLQSLFGGYMYITWDETGQKYLNWIDEDALHIADQSIEFGSNLLDYSHDWDITDLCTVVVPLGKQLEFDDEGNEIETEERLTIKSVNNNSEFLVNEETAKKYGYIVKSLEYDDIEDPNELKRLGELYLREGQFDKMIIEISAYDMAMMNPKIEWEPPKRGD